MLEFFVTRPSRALYPLFATLVLLAALSGCTVPVNTAPNIVLILTDDQPLELTAFMPTLQNELVAKGTSFEQAFATTSLCCPARVSILRGQYVHNHQVLSNGGLQGGFPKFYQTGFEASTVATWLQAKGYRTGMLGKYMNAYPFGPAGEDPVNYRPPRPTYVPPGWNDWFGLFDVPKDIHNNPYPMYDYNVNDNGREVHYANKESDYQVDVLSDRADRFVRQSRGKPFFLYLAPTAPHLPTVMARRHEGLFAGIQAPRSPSFNEADTSDKPRWVRSVPPLSDAEIAKVDETYSKEAEMMLAVDDMLARVLETLKSVGQLQNTYIIFTTDQGFHMGEHRLTDMKLTPYAGASEIPLIVRGPDVPANETRPEMALGTDLAPTFAAIADVTPPDFVDGRSLKGIWEGKDAQEPWRQAALQEFWPRADLGDYGLEHLNRIVEVPRYRAFRTPELLFSEYFYKDGSSDGELYDLTNDPFELENLYASTDPEILARLSSYTEKLQACSGVGCRELENTPPDIF